MDSIRKAGGHSLVSDGISWQERVANIDVLERAFSFSMNTLLSQRNMRWLGHVHGLVDGRIPKYLLYGDYVTRCPCLRYKVTGKQEDERNERYNCLRKRPTGNRGLQVLPLSAFSCSKCDRDCSARLGLLGHTKRCVTHT